MYRNYDSYDEMIISESAEDYSALRFLNLYLLINVDTTLP